MSSVFFDDQDPDLDIFRSFRDNQLQGTNFGRAMIAWYYNASPGLSDALAEKPLAQTVVRAFMRIVAFYLRWQEIFYLVLVATFGIALLPLAWWRKRSRLVLEM